MQGSGNQHPLWFKWYFDLYWGHRAKACSIGARGLWTELVMILQKPPVGRLAIGDIVLTKAKLPALTGISTAEFEELFPEILGAGLLHEDPEGGYLNPHILRQGEISQARARSGAIGGKVSKPEAKAQANRKQKPKQTGSKSPSKPEAKAQAYRRQKTESTDPSGSGSAKPLTGSQRDVRTVRELFVAAGNPRPPAAGRIAQWLRQYRDELGEAEGLPGLLADLRALGDLLGPPPRGKGVSYVQACLQARLRDGIAGTAQMPLKYQPDAGGDAATRKRAERLDRALKGEDPE